MEGLYGGYDGIAGDNMGLYRGYMGYVGILEFSTNILNVNGFKVLGFSVGAYLNRHRVWVCYSTMYLHWLQGMILVISQTST